MTLGVQSVWKGYKKSPIWILQQFPSHPIFSTFVLKKPFLEEKTGFPISVSPWPTILSQKKKGIKATKQNKRTNKKTPAMSNQRQMWIFPLRSFPFLKTLTIDEKLTKINKNSLRNLWIPAVYFHVTKQVAKGENNYLMLTLFYGY